MNKALLLLLFCVSSYAQDATSKYNSLLNRYEFFDSHGYLTGYKTYNNLNQSWEYYAVNSQSRPAPQSNVNLPLVAAVLNAKQSQYDNNKQRINEALDKIYDVLGNITNSQDFNHGLVMKFSREYVEPMKQKRFDYSSVSTTNSVIEYLQKSAGQLIHNENLD